MCSTNLFRTTAASPTDEIERLHRLRNRLDARITQCIAQLNVSGAAQAEGYLSTQAFLRHRLRMSPGAARQQVVMAKAVQELPMVASAYADGELSAAHVASIAHGVERVGAEVVARGEGILVDAARQLDPVQLRRVVTHLRHIVDPDGADADAAEAYERRGLYASPTLDGMVRVDGLLDPDTGEALLAAVNSGPPPAADDHRSPAQRRADRLGEVLRAFLGSGQSPTSGGQSAQVTLTADLDTLRGERGTAPTLEWIGPIDPATARLLGCDCQVTGVVLGSDGSPLDVGWRHRTATGKQRIALAVRDQHCQAPGCDRPASWCDAHHVVPWYHGGRTDLDNLVLLCRRHHRAVHQGVWRIDALGGGRFRFVHISDRTPVDDHERQPRAG